MDISYMILMSSFSRIDFGKGIFTYEVLSLLLLVTGYNIMKEKGMKYLNKFFTYIYTKCVPKQSVIEIVGWESLANGLYAFEYCHNMKAINYYVYNNHIEKP